MVEETAGVGAVAGAVVLASTMSTLIVHDNSQYTAIQHKKHINYSTII